jgi:hypothetical protein
MSNGRLPSLTWAIGGFARSRGLVVVALALCAAGFGRPPAAEAFEIVVPAYFYPGNNSPWTAMTNAADEVDITAIMNPGNGPGGATDGNYVAAINAFRAAGGRVIGYVYSGYGLRPLAQVKADVDKYAAWYAIDGIFVDEMANTGPAEKLNYYKSLYDYVKSKNADWEVMGNPGTTTIEQYATWPTADRFMVFENVGTEYPPYAPSAWNANYDRSRFVHLVHTEPSETNMETAITLAAQRNAGGIYVTNDVLNNPWDTLPTYWQAEVDTVAAVHDTFAAGDFNEDGAVDAADLATWQQGFGEASTRLWHRDGDATEDGVINGADFLRWQQQVGGAGVVGAGVVGVGTSAALGGAGLAPEPSSIMLLGLAGFVVRCAHSLRDG